jgi:hypothetical protein
VGKTGHWVPRRIEPEGQKTEEREGAGLQGAERGREERSQATMDDKRCNEQNDLMLRMLYEDLSTMMSKARHLLTITLSPDETAQLVHYAVEIRRLMESLEHKHLWSPDDAIGRSLSDITQQLLDLEGRLK